MPNSTRIYLGILVLVVLQRFCELLISRKHTRSLLVAGGIESGSGHYRWMVSLHSIFLLACPLEVFLLHRPFLRFLGYPMVGVLVLAMGLRFWSMKTLGRRWTTRVITVPGSPRIASGPYRYLSHPNYVAVVLEFVALPLLHSAWITAGLSSLLNGLLLRTRISVEDAALTRAGESR
jgi:methyltransferase